MPPRKRTHNDEADGSSVTASPPDSKRLLTHDELEPWRVDNAYIITGYRPTLRSYKLCFRSVFGSHNETVNIWTHLLGCSIAIAALLYAATLLTDDSALHSGRRGWAAPFAPIPNPFPSNKRPSVQLIDFVGFVTFFASAATCLGFSGTFHTLSCHSKEVAHRWNQFDYAGIVVLISGTFVPAVRYGFFCDPHLRTFYICAIYLVGAGTAYTVLAPHARTPEYRRFRAWVFIGMGLSAVFPVGHAVVRYGLERASESLSLQWLALGGFLYILGAVLYAERVPERFAPGKFDIVGASHQIFHVLILLAAWSHWCAIAEGYRYWHEERAGVCWST
ncbi:hypothetical protein ACM66B_000883 [Microbotryomycetes sp. NB124-2]